MKSKNKRVKGERKKRFIFLFVFFILSVATVILGILCLQNIKKPFVRERFIPFSALIGACVLALYGLCAWFTATGKESLTKSALSVYIFLVFALSFCFILQKTGFFEVVNDAERLQAYLEKGGIWMPALYVLLQFLQVVVLPIPSIVSTVAGVALFGAFWTTAYSLIGIILGSIAAFLIGRKLGYRAVSWMVGEETLKKWQTKMKGKDKLFLSTMFLLPVFPDDILCFLAGLSTMSVRYFLIVIVISRVIAVSATCYSFNFIPFNTWWGLTIWGVFLVGIALIFVLVYRNMDKIQRMIKGKKKKEK